MTDTSKRVRKPLLNAPRPLLIVGGALLFGGGPGCLEPGTSGGTDAIADTPGDVSTDSSAEVSFDVADASCWSPPANLETLIGQSCDSAWAERGVCTDGKLVAWCRGEVWTRALSPDDDFCWCSGPVECEPESVVCGAVGFVGIAKAGRARKGGASIRVS